MQTTDTTRNKEAVKPNERARRGPGQCVQKENYGNSVRARRLHSEIYFQDYLLLSLIYYLMFI